ncbi:MAG: SGNH/GDSL hydrolase family protein [Chloroflexi bacterium]|nr:SGNH/GDSL hydrolase family protein [Chloroflexota bacterium]
MGSFRILCYGDSNTWGYIPQTADRYPRAVRWTGVMAGRLGNRFDVIEEGQNGRTTVWDDPLEGDKNGLRYLPACLESHKPLDLVILMLGTNDLKARFSLTTLDISFGVERLAQVILQSGCGTGSRAPAILLAAPPPVLPQGDLAEMFLGAREKSMQLAGRFAAVAQRCGCAFLDVSQVISVDPADGIHYSPQAHNKLGNAMADCVHSILSTK